MKRLLVLLCLTGCTAGFTAGSSTTSSGPGPGPGPAPGGDPAPMAGGGGGWTLEERQYWTKLQEELDDWAKQTDAHCGSRITASYVKETFRGRFTAGGNYGLDSYTRGLCGAMLKSMLELCGYGADAKQAVASQVHAVECEFGPARYSLENGVFHAGVNHDSDQYSVTYRAMMDFLQKSL